jgi:dipeptidyl aminopeptidase/acylaminoacyl peptidase
MHMDVCRLVAVLLCLAGLSGPVRGEVNSADDSSIDAYGRLPSIEDLALSPDGTRLAIVHSQDNERRLTVVVMGDNKVLGHMNLGDTKLRGLEWADNHQIMITTASTTMPDELVGGKAEWHLMRMYDVETNKIHGLLGHIRDDVTTMNVAYGAPIVAAKAADPAIFLHGFFFANETRNLDRGTRPALIRVDLRSGAESIVKLGGAATRSWTVNDSGEIVAEEDYINDKHRWEIQLMQDGRVRQTLSGVAALDHPEILGLTADNAALVVSVHEDAGTSWKQLSLKDGSWGGEIAPDDPLTHLVHDGGSRRMIGTAFIGDSVHYHFADGSVQQRWEWIERQFRKERVEYVATSADHTRFLVEVFGPTTGFAYYFADASEHITRLVGKIYAAVRQIGEVRAITYPAADGLQIPAYLTLPPGHPEKNLPVIVMPHGGPQVRDTLGFDWWAQAYAALGYAVLQPNYRGSNLSQSWVERGYGEWGRQMQSDLSDGLRYLAKAGLVDAGRACIVGASYGGYAALAGATLEAGTYRCAIAVAGVSDPANMLNRIRQSTWTKDSEEERYWDRFMGVDGPKDKRLDQISPLKHADRVQAPVLLIHGEEDTVVPYEQSTDMVSALKKLGKPVEFVALKKEDHHLSRSETRLQMLRTSVEFLRRVNPPDPS